MKRVLKIGKLLCAASLLTGLTLSQPAITHAAANSKLKLFGTKEIKSSKLGKFKKWTEMLDRYTKEAPAELNKCKLSAKNKCLVTKWRIALNKMKGMSDAQKIKSVNAYINKWVYILDPINYGQPDYWATPKQFMNRSGDCEDYAIAKYISLSHLGFPKEKMRIVVLQDLNLNIPHAVLMVEHEGKTLILDNQISSVISADRIKHYKPIYSINEKYWWLHRGFKS